METPNTAPGCNCSPAQLHHMRAHAPTCPFPSGLFPGKSCSCTTADTEHVPGCPLRGPQKLPKESSKVDTMPLATQQCSSRLNLGPMIHLCTKNEGHEVDHGNSTNSWKDAHGSRPQEYKAHKFMLNGMSEAVEDPSEKYVRDAVRRQLEMRESAVRDELISLGWKPPVEKLGDVIGVTMEDSKPIPGTDRHEVKVQLGPPKDRCQEVDTFTDGDGQCVREAGHEGDHRAGKVAWRSGPDGLLRVILDQERPWNGVTGKLKELNIRFMNSAKGGVAYQCCTCRADLGVELPKEQHCPPAPKRVASIAAVTQQKPPVKTEGPSMHDLVMDDLRDRQTMGLNKYKQLLQVGNGRVMLVDAFQEMLDFLPYMKGALIEWDQMVAERLRLAQRVEQLEHDLMRAEGNFQRSQAMLAKLRNDEAHRPKPAT